MPASLPLAAPVVVAALYKFAGFDEPAAIQQSLHEICQTHGIRGTLLIAREGINGTVAGTAEAIDLLIAHIRTLPGCADIEVKYSHASEMPFYRMKVRLKKEIVTMGVPEVDPVKDVGTYLDPADWNQLLADPETVIIDTRNDYEYQIGTFKGAVNPKTDSFREFPGWFDEFAKQYPPQTKFAMFCTGGIRCEKATAFVKLRGRDNVYHLKGGILKYLETVPRDESLWEGECFVFDHRVAVGHGLVEGQHGMCHACGYPVSPSDMKSPDYIQGVQCPHCATMYDAERKKRFAERQRQIKLAKERSARHMGACTIDPSRRDV